MNKLKYILSTAAAGIILCTALPIFLPLTGDQQFSSDYRIPYYLGEDYFLFRKYADTVSGGMTIPVIGDSVIWGHYTSDADTLTAQMNRASGFAKFSNLGIDGIHPAAMYGLTDLCCGSIKNRKVIVGINLLWMSSARHDLTGAKNSEINHRMLLPQFTSSIPAYSPSVEEKLSFYIKREIPFLLWIDHIKLTEFRDKNFYRWSMGSPAESFFSYFSPGSRIYKEPAPMDSGKLPRQSVEWIKTDKSLQWSYTVKTIKLLQKNNNRVLALVTPFNRHMLTDESAIKHELIANEIKTLLQREGITVVIPSTPAKDEFADSSHPTGKGYGTIAKELLKNAEFISFIDK